MTAQIEARWKPRNDFSQSISLNNIDHHLVRTSEHITSIAIFTGVTHPNFVADAAEISFLGGRNILRQLQEELQDLSFSFRFSNLELDFLSFSFFYRRKKVIGSAADIDERDEHGQGTYNQDICDWGM